MQTIQLLRLAASLTSDGRCLSEY